MDVVRMTFKGIGSLFLMVLASALFSCSQFVDVKPTSVKIVNTNPNGEYLEERDMSFLLSLEWTPANVSEKYKNSVKWESSDSDVITCYMDGYVWPRKPGRSTISVSVEFDGGSVSDSIDFYVTESLSDFEFAPVEGETDKVAIVRYKGYANAVVVPKEVVIEGKPRSVAVVLAGAFENKDDLIEVSLPDSVEVLETGAFRGCAALSVFKTPESLKSIGNECFSGCSFLTSFMLPAGTESIGTDAFSGCSRLFEVDNRSELVLTLGSTEYGGIAANAISLVDGSKEGDEGKSRLRTIDKVVYYVEDDESLTAKGAIPDIQKIKIDSACAKIPAGVFSGLQKLTSVDLSDANIIEIGERAFSGCRTVSGITLNSGLKKIGERAFSGCMYLSELEVPDSVTEIGPAFLEGCGELKSLTVPFVGKLADPESGERYPFGYFFSDADSTSGFYRSSQIEQFKPVYDSELSMWTYPVAAYHVPYLLESMTITKMTEMPALGTNTAGKHNIFENCEDLKSVTLAEPLESIGEYCFRGCKNLESISLPSTLASIAQTAFEGCCFKNVVYSREGEDAGKYDFSSGRLTIKELPSVGTNSKWYSDGIDPLVLEVVFSLASQPTSITSNCFRDCASLKSITVPDSITTIGDSAFEKCMSLEEFAFPNGINYIGRKAFAYCASLKKAEIVSSSLIEIDSGAFGGCVSLEEMTIPFVGIFRDGSSSSDGYHFGRLFSGYEFKDFKYGFFSRSSKETTQSNQGSSGGESTYYIPESLKKVTVLDGDVGYGAFNGCEWIREVVLGDGVDSLGDKAFKGCRFLKKVTLPTGLTSLNASEIFAGCNSLDNIVVPASCVAIASGIFAGTYGDYPIYLLAADSADFSQFAEGWDRLENDSVHPVFYYSSDQPSQTQVASGKSYWHYDADDKPVAWT